ncbi:hypothetical protein D3C72_1422520 [compost metagenome]
MGVDGPDAFVGRAGLIQQGDQGARRQSLGHVEVGQLAQAQPLQGGVQHGRAGVAAPAAGGAKRHLAPRLGEAPVLGGADQAVVAGDLGQVARGAPPSQIVGAGAQDQPS